MATIVFSTAASSSDRIWYGSITATAINSVTWGDGTTATTFLGNFGYRSGKIVSGTLKQYTQTIDGDTHYTVTGLNYSGLQLQHWWDLRSPASFMKAIFAGNDSIVGSDDADVLSGFGGGRDTLLGNDGDDTITGGSSNDSIGGGDGDDVLNGGSGAQDTINGNDGNDTITAGGYAVVSGGSGNDTYLLSSGVVRITEGSGADAGDDEVITKYSYTLSANIETLTLTSTTNAIGAGNDQANLITGNTGNNLLRGYGGNDTLDGGLGNDTLSGGLGHDIATGGVSDILTGGAGKDVFLFEFTPNATTSISEVADFTHGQDRIALQFSTFYNVTDQYIGFKTAGDLRADQFHLTTDALPTGTTPEETLALQQKIRLTYDPGTGILMYDPDGVGAHPNPKNSHATIDLAPVQIAIVTVDGTTPATLNYHDFFVVKM